jgi:hypothetical protein
MVPLAVSNNGMAATNFRWIYPEGAIYHDSLLSGSYPHFSGEQFVWNYLTKTIKVSKISQD